MTPWYLWYIERSVSWRHCSVPLGCYWIVGAIVGCPVGVFFNSNKFKMVKITKIFVLLAVMMVWLSQTLVCFFKGVLSKG